MGKFESAKVLFEFFAENAEKQLGKGSWFFRKLDHELASQAGLSLEDAKIGWQVLETKDLVVMKGAGGQLELTVRGTEVAMHPEQLDEALGPKRATAPVVNFNGPTQTGAGSTMNIMTYHMVLTQLLQQVERSPNLPAEKKSAAKKAIEKVLELAGSEVLKAAVKAGADLLS